MGESSTHFERIEARLARRSYAPHRHDTYALGVTLGGVQTFCYRGGTHASLPGQVLVLHPDGVHDGAAGSEIGLRYRMLYVAPELLRNVLGKGPLPFVPAPVVEDVGFRKLLLEALAELDVPLDDLRRDALAVGLAHALLRHAGMVAATRPAIDWQLVARARDYLRAHADRVVGSAELEGASGLDRFALARQFRAAYATSPHRYLLMRRLQRGREMLARGHSPAEVAAAIGFADQSHFGRHFKRAYGLTPASWAALAQPRPAR